MAPWSKSKSPASPEPAHRNANTPDSSVASDNHTDTEKPESEKNKLWEFFKIMKTFVVFSILSSCGLLRGIVTEVKTGGLPCTTLKCGMFED